MTHNDLNGEELGKYLLLTKNFQTRVPHMISAPGPTVPKSATDLGARAQTSVLKSLSLDRQTITPLRRRISIYPSLFRVVENDPTLQYNWIELGGLGTCGPELKNIRK